MQAEIREGKPTVTCNIGELPIRIVYADCRDMSFDSSEGPCTHTDPSQVTPPKSTLVGFQFKRCPEATFVIDGEERTVRGYAVWTSPRYYLDCEIMDLPTFIELAKRDLEPSRFDSLKRQLDWQKAEDWDGVLVIYIEGSNGRVWRQYKWEPDQMVALNKDGSPVNVMKTTEGDVPINN